MKRSLFILSLVVLLNQFGTSCYAMDEYNKADLGQARRGRPEDEKTVAEGSLVNMSRTPIKPAAAASSNQQQQASPAVAVNPAVGVPSDNKHMASIARAAREDSEYLARHMPNGFVAAQTEEKKEAEKQLVKIKKLSRDIFYECGIDAAKAKQVLAKCPDRLSRLIKVLENRSQNPVSSWPKKFLFVGDPGTGKSATAVAIAYECDIPMLFFYASHIANAYKASGDQKIIQIFSELAALDQECIIVIDELQSLIEKKDNINDSDKSMLDSIWTCLDKYKNSKLIFIGTMNYNGKMPPQLKDRLKQTTFEFAMPESNENEVIVAFYKNMHMQQGINFEEPFKPEDVASYFNGLSRRAIEEIFSITATLARSNNPTKPVFSWNDFKESVAKQKVDLTKDPKERGWFREKMNEKTYGYILQTAQVGLSAATLVVAIQGLGLQKNSAWWGKVFGVAGTTLSAVGAAAANCVIS